MRYLSAVAVLSMLCGCAGPKDDTALEAGIEALSKGEYETAARHLEAAAKLRSASPSAYCNLGIAYWKLGLTERAISALSVSADLAGTDPRPLEFLVQVYAGAERWDDARKVVKTLTDGMPDTPRILTLQAAIEYRSGNSSGARGLLDRAVEIDPRYPPALYNFGVLARESGDSPETMARYFREYLAVADDPVRERVARELLGTLSRPKPPPAPPVPTVPTVPPATPVRPAAQPPSEALTRLLNGASRAISAQAYDEALILLNQAVQQNPQSPDAAWKLAELYDRHLGYKQRAEALYAEFRRRFPDDPRSAGEGSTAAGRTGSVDPDRSLEAWNRAVAAHARGDLDEAVRQYDAALRYNPHFPNAAYNLGLAYRSKGDIPAAKRALQRALSIQPGMANAHYMLAVVCGEAGQFAEAIEQARKAVAASPDYAKAHFLLAQLYRSSGRAGPAAEHFAKAAEHAADPDLADKARAGLDSLKGP